MNLETLNFQNTGYEMMKQTLCSLCFISPGSFCFFFFLLVVPSFILSFLIRLKCDDSITEELFSTLIFFIIVTTTWLFRTYIFRRDFDIYSTNLNGNLDMSKFKTSIIFDSATALDRCPLARNRYKLTLRPV